MRRLSDTRKDDTLLAFKVREMLTLPTYLDRDRLSAYSFETLCKGAREVHLFLSRMTRRKGRDLWSAFCGTDRRETG